MSQGRQTNFVMLRRGLLEHIATWPPAAAKLYVALLMLAKPKGRGAGTYTTSFGDLAAKAGLSKKTVISAARFLENGDHPYIEIERGGNQHSSQTTFKILRFAGGESAPTAGGEAAPAQESAGV